MDALVFSGSDGLFPLAFRLDEPADADDDEAATAAAARKFELTS